MTHLWGLGFPSESYPVNRNGRESCCAFVPAELAPHCTFSNARERVGWGCIGVGGGLCLGWGACLVESLRLRLGGLGICSLGAEFPSEGQVLVLAPLCPELPPSLGLCISDLCRCPQRSCVPGSLWTHLSQHRKSWRTSKTAGIRRTTRPRTCC